MAPQWAPKDGDVLFVAGTDWRYLSEAGLDALPNPTINLVQGVRHADVGTELYGYLEKRAVRICVSQEVADAITATDRVNGPVFVIPNGVDMRMHGPAERLPGLADAAAGVARVAKRTALLRLAGQGGIIIIGYKRPELARALSHSLNQANLPHRLLDSFMPRHEFLLALAGASVAVCLPYAEEGFYLPALEAMAAGCLPITLDCIGNRGFCRNGRNCFIAPANPADLAAAVAQAVRLDALQRDLFRRHAKETVGRHSLAAERSKFHAILKDIRNIWGSVWEPAP